MREFIYFNGNFIFFEDDNAEIGEFLPVSVNYSGVNSKYPKSFLLLGDKNNYSVKKSSLGYTLFRGDEVCEFY